MTNTQTNERTPNKSTLKIQETTTELLQDIGDRLNKSNEEVKDLRDNPDPVLNHETYKKYEAYVGQNVQLPINRIALSDNVRSRIDIDDDDFQRLVADIAKNGVQQNVIVELVKTQTGGKLICVAGHRRITAAIHTGILTHIPALLKRFDTRGDRTQSALAENLLRKDLHCLDVAEGYQKMLKEGWSVDQIAQHFERHKTTVVKFLRIAEFPSDIKETLQQNSEVFTNRVIFNDLLGRNKLPSELRRDVNRRLSKKSPNKKPVKPKIQDQLTMFFEQEPITDQEREIVLSAFKFVGLLK